MQFKGFAEFGLLLASFSYALEKMVDNGEVRLSLISSDEVTKKEETLDDIVKEFEKLTRETAFIKDFKEPVIFEEVKEEEDKPEVTQEIIQQVIESELAKEEVVEDDLVLVNELRKKILEAFEEKENEVEEVFDVASSSIPETKEEVVNTLENRLNVNTSNDQADRLRAELLADFNDYIADVKSVYGKPSKITSAIDSMVEHTSIMNDIKRLYPNLEEAFINEYYRLKDAINNENPVDKEGVMLHRLSFGNKDNLRAFADHMIEEGIMVNINENKLIADVIRPIITKNGKVMAEIFKVANSAAAYRGFYVGYLVK